MALNSSKNDYMLSMETVVRLTTFRLGTFQDAAILIVDGQTPITNRAILVSDAVAITPKTTIE